jgi:GntR family histidine utilization transcriptional repressor
VIVPEFLSIDFSETTPTDYLISQVVPDRLEHIVQAILPDEFIVEHLAISRGEPCLKLQRRTWIDQQVVTAVDLIYPSSRYELGATYSPTQPDE